MSLIFPKKEILYAPMLGTLGGGSGRGFGQFGGAAVLAGEVILEGTQSTSSSTVTSRNWTVPAGVSSISIVAVGGGGAGVDRHDGMGGGGGGLAWYNDVAVNAGDTLVLNAGAGGTWGSLSTTRSNNDGASGGSSYITLTNGSNMCIGYGGPGGNHNTYSTTNQWYSGGQYANSDGGGTGGQVLRKSGSRSGGSGAGGYTGSGGRAGAKQYDSNFAASAGAGGAGGGGEGSNGANPQFCSGGGGVGIYGQGTNGAASTSNNTVTAAQGGSGGGASSVSGGNHSFPMPNGGSYGGGGGGAHNGDYPGNGTRGVIRVIWGEVPRQFPSTNVDLANSFDNVTYL